VAAGRGITAEQALRIMTIVRHPDFDDDVEAA
jgi:hypothetical protein